ncbi:helix-turn-helix domain-containing protein [Burkholderia sp. USMB20]|nr:helix-turn-helix domain-containing protein [Burkholderia sp. USMB20]
MNINPPRAEPSSRRVGLLVTPQFSHLGLGILIELMSLANRLDGRALYEWVVLSIDGGIVRAANGMSTPSQPVGCERDAFSTIFVFANLDAMSDEDDLAIRTWLRNERASGVQIGGIEGGADILASAGLLDGRSSAIHWNRIERFRSAYPEVRATTQIFTIELDTITCAGEGAIADMMLEWIGLHHGSELTDAIGGHWLHARLRDGSERQIMNAHAVARPMNGLVCEAIRLMRESMTTPMSCRAIAQALRMSTRQLERLFMQHVATTPMKYYMTLRIEFAHKLLMDTDLNVSKVAVATGFHTTEHFGRVYKAMFGCPPSRARLDTDGAPAIRQWGASCSRSLGDASSRIGITIGEANTMATSNK